MPLGKVKFKTYDSEKYILFRNSPNEMTHFMVLLMFIMFAEFYTEYEFIYKFRFLFYMHVKISISKPTSMLVMIISGRHYNTEDAAQVNRNK